MNLRTLKESYLLTSRRAYNIILGIITIAVIAGCSEKVEQPAPPRIDIHVLFAYDGFCNVSYNDMVLEGIEKNSQKYGFDYSFTVPESIEDGMENYRKWCTNPMEEGVDKSLYIFASNIYADPLSREEHPDPETGKEILLFETENEVPYAYSFGMSYYGLSYVMAKLFHRMPWKYDFVIVPANPYIYGLDHINDAILTSIDEEGKGTLDHNYLNIMPGKGMDQQNLAFMICYSIFNEWDPFTTIVIPYGGMSNLGVYRYIAKHFGFCVGMDYSNQTYATYLMMSMNKKMDMAFSNFFDKWLKDEQVPRHQFYTLESGLVNLTYEDGFVTPTAVVDSLQKIAIEKEKIYFSERARENE